MTKPLATARPFALALALLSALPAAALAAETTGYQPPRLRAARVEAPPSIEEFARAMDAGTQPRTPMTRVDGFVNRLPRDGEPASQDTIVYLGRDDRALYVVFLAYSQAEVRASLIARDRIQPNEDSVAVQIDTFRDFRRAVGLQVNAAGARQDGYWVEGSGWSLDPDFDYPVETRRTSRGYLVKYTIPFASLNYPDGADEWGLLLYRLIPASQEDAFWPQYSRAIQGRMNQAAILDGMGDIPASARGRVTPYLAITDASVEGRAERDYRPGLDARWRLGPGSELALTLNPDFGQVESDQPQIAANQRFELFYPEKRPFFADHARYFATPVNLLFTRRLREPSAGLKAVGQANGLTWASLLVRDDPDDGAQRDLFAGRARYDLRKDLSLGLGLVSFGEDEANAIARNDVLSVDARWQPLAQWTVQAQAARSRDDLAEGAREGDAAFVQLRGGGTQWGYELTHQRIDHDFRAAAGFVPRTGIVRTGQYAGWTHYPSAGPLVSFTSELRLDYLTDPHGRRLDRGAEFDFTATLPYNGSLGVFAGPRRERLLPGDFPGLIQPLDFSADYVGAQAGATFGRLAASLRYVEGDRINVVPVAGALPRQARFGDATATLNLRLSEQLTNENTVLYTRLDEADGGARVFDQTVVRSKWLYYFNPDWSLRLIGQYLRTRAVPTRTALEDDEGANLDLLLAWQPSPYRSWFLGYNSDYAGTGLDLPRGGPLQRRARSLYLKFSWSLDFG